VNAQGHYEVVVVGASWGGLVALERLLAELPDDVETPIVIAQHRSPESELLRNLLQTHTARTVCEAGDKDPLRPRMVYLAPPDYHLLIEGREFALSTDERVQYARPSIDVLFESAADAFREKTVAVVLTGANDDGAHGAARIRDRGGIVVVQDPREAERRAMPDAAIAAANPHAVLPVAEIARFLGTICTPHVGSHA
jgi:two-component system chemotaxis response regulator CheB